MELCLAGQWSHVIGRGARLRMAATVVAQRPDDPTSWLQYADFLISEGEHVASLQAILCVQPACHHVGICGVAIAWAAVSALDLSSADVLSVVGPSLEERPSR